METEVEESPNTATAPEPSSATIARSARPVLVRFAELEPLAMTALSSCAQPVTDTAEGRAGEDESHGGVADCNGENRPNDQSYCRDADVDGVLGVCHISKGSRGKGLNWPRLCMSCQAAVVINWNFFPRSKACPDELKAVISVFQAVEKLIDSETHEKQESNEVLARVTDGLLDLGFEVEIGKKGAEKIFVPVLFGTNGKVEKRFDADAWHRDWGIVLEVEAGRALMNNQFLKDIFQASMMHGVDYCIVAVRNIYQSGKSKDFEKNFHIRRNDVCK